jgi:AcrR family transcriptional regulator
MNQLDSTIAAFHLPTVLAERVPAAGKAPKRVRTRLALIAATAAELEDSGYDGLTIDGIVERAGMARGTFYIYFGNRSDAAAAVKRAFDALMRQRRPRAGSKLSATEAIYKMNRFYIACYSRNAKIMLGHEALLRERPDLARSRDVVNHRWAAVVLHDVARRLGLPKALRYDTKAMLSVRAVIAMADELLRETFAYQSPHLTSMIRSEEELAEVMTFVWHRAVYGCDPEGISWSTSEHASPAVVANGKSRIG